MPQVRELAAACISGFVRCGFFSCLDKLKVPNYFIRYVCLVCTFDNVCLVPIIIINYNIIIKCMCYNVCTLIMFKGIIM